MDRSTQQTSRIISAEEFAKGWDSERRIHELNDLELSLRGTTLYMPARTKSDFEETFGGPVTHVKFRTFEDDFLVWLTPCKPTDPEARPLTPTTDTQSAAQLGFAIPLRKMHITVPETRQFTFKVERIPVEGGGAVYEISFKEFRDERRQVDEETLAAIKRAKAEQVKARRAQKRAERLTRLQSTASGSTGAAKE